MRRITACLLFVCAAANVHAWEVTSVSVDSTGIQGNAPSIGASLSADGRFVAFDSGATNLVPNDVNGQYDVFVHDRATGTTELISLDMQGQPALFGGDSGVISGDGRFVAFASWADDLVVNDTNGWMDVFVRDRLLGVTQCVSVEPSNTPANRISRNPALSADGRFVAFESRATTILTAPDANFFLEDVFVRDLLTGTTEIVSIATTGEQGNSLSRYPSLSGDGRFVAFESAADNLVPNDTNGVTDVFVRDRLLGTTVRVSVSSGGAQADESSTKPSISGDGRFVAYECLATNLAPGDTNGTWDIYVHDLLTGTTVRGSVDSNGAQGSGHSFLPHLDHDGTHLVFESEDPLDATDTNGSVDVFVRDLTTGLTRRAGVTSTGAQIDDVSWFPAISADGSSIAFTSVAPGIVPGDNNLVEDVFVNAWVADWSAVCLGDGSGSTCPCGNNSTTAEQAGCTHSAGSAGRLTAIGTPSVTGDSFALLGNHMPNGPALYAQGTSVAAGGAGSVFGDGLLCVSGPLTRLGVRFNASGASQYPGPSDLVVSVAGSCMAGAQNSYQAWYRDAAVFCQNTTYNLTNGILVTWKP